MRLVSLSIVTSLCLAAGLAAQDNGVVLDSNTAYYEGESLRYVFPAPKGFRMVTDEAAGDGYSFAFVPKVDDYSSAMMMIGVNIYKIRGIDFDSVLVQDTLSIRKHYGADILIRPVDSVFAGSGEAITAFYLDSKQRFIPNVMLSYFDGKTELIIFELVIDPNALRPKTEEIYLACIQDFRALKRGTLGRR
ncbi:MAG: hypothetical protein AB1644_05755 [Candidatus Zixiibacteriota bacterium]